MIISQKQLSIPEVKEYIGKNKEKNAKIKAFLESFSKLSPKDAKEMKKKIEELEFINVRDEHIIKIIDILPENIDDLNKIFSSSQFDEEEIKKILGIVQEYK